MKNSESLKNKFVEFAEEKERIENEKKMLEQKINKLGEEHSKLHIKEEKLGQAIELLESIGM